jgi:hypothetical protein
MLISHMGPLINTLAGQGMRFRYNCFDVKCQAIARLTHGKIHPKMKKEIIIKLLVIAIPEAKNHVHKIGWTESDSGDIEGVPNSIPEPLYTKIIEWFAKLER